ncbi:MAG: oxidoreductase [Chitinophagaceae bacterium]
MPVTIQTGLIGFGISAQVFHAPFLTTVPGFNLSAVVERTGSRAAQSYPEVRTFRDPKDLFEDPSIDLVVITTPNDSHYSLARQGLLAGKHVLVEKPFTIRSADALELIDLAAQQKKVLSVYQNRRYVGDFLTIQEILKNNLLGEIMEWEAHYDRYRPELRPGAWREKPLAGSGILYDLGAHLIDQALVLFGIPLTITAVLRIQRPGAKAIDYFDLSLDYEHLRVILKGSMLVRETGPRYMIHGRSGSYIKYGEDPQEALLRSGIKPISPDWGKEPEENWGMIHFEDQGKSIREKYPTLPGNYGNFYRDFYQSIAEGAPLPVRAQEGYNTVHMLELALESNELGKTIPCQDFIITKVAGHFLP